MFIITTNNNNNSVTLVRELYRPKDRRFSVKLVPTSTDIGCRVVSAMDPYSGILDFLDRTNMFINKQISVICVMFYGSITATAVHQTIWKLVNSVHFRCVLAS
jgi:hypothetical protein